MKVTTKVLIRIVLLCSLVAPCGIYGGEVSDLLDSNLRCVDLSDLTSSVPLTVGASSQILWRTETWEHNTFDATDNDSVGYPSVVKNDRGRNADNKYYLYYAHHDPCSGIGCAVADRIQGPYRKLASLETNRPHSMVLANPHYPIMTPPLADPSHYSSPCVIWNEDKDLWFMYFHYYNHYHEAWKNAGGAGYGPYFLGYLGKDKPSYKYIVVWGESPAEGDAPKVMYGYTTDFTRIQRDPRGYANWNIAVDGPISPWREGDRLYLFSGKQVQLMILPVLSRAPGMTKREGLRAPEPAD